MSKKPRSRGPLGRLRLLLSAPTFVIAFVVWLLVLPLTFTGAALFDVITLRLKLPTVRLLLFAGLYLGHEIYGMMTALGLWFGGGLGRRIDAKKHSEFQGWWITSLLSWARRLLGIRVETKSLDDIPDGRFILLSRHASMIDAVLPVDLIISTLGRPVRYVLKEELLWDPCFDLFGNRLPNVFVKRSGNNDGEAERIHQLAAANEDDSVLVIFPEGTYADDKSIRKVRESLERKGDSATLDVANRLQYLLPPRPTGTLALLQAQPDFDVLIYGHVGLEGISGLASLRNMVPFSKPVKVDWWVHQRDTIPEDPEGQVTWLNDRWLELDEWVATHKD